MESKICRVRPVRKGRDHMRLSFKMEELLPTIEKYIRDQITIPEDTELVYTSHTTFLTFDVVKSEKTKERKRK